MINGEGAVFRPDSYDYLRLADGLASEGVYGPGEIFRAPGYPLFLSLFYSTTGSVIFVAIIQVLIDVGTCLLTFSLIFKITGNRKVAFAGFIISIFSIVNIAFSSLLLSETLYTFLLVLFFNFYYQFFTKEDQRISKILLLSFIFICLVYVRAISTLYFPLVIIFLLSMKKYRESLIFSAAVLLVCGLWVVRNSSVANFRGFSSVSSINLYRYNACLLLAKKNGISVSEQRELIDKEFQSLGSHNEVVALAKRKGLSTILSDPLYYTYLHFKSNVSNFAPAIGDYLKNCGVLIGGNDTLSVVQSEGVLSGIKNYLRGNYRLMFLLVPATIVLLTVYFAMGSAVFFKLKSRSINRFECFLLLTFFYFMMVPGPASHPRFRVPAGPVIAYFAAFGICRFLKTDDLFENDKSSAQEVKNECNSGS